MKAIRYMATLFYYDGPQVFEACDVIGGHYVAVAVETQDAGERYLVVGVAPERLRKFRNGTLDLRTLIVEAGQEEWYLATTTDLTRPVNVEQQEIPIVESGLLPDEGFVLHDRPTEEFALGEARTRQNLVLEVAIEPPEAAREHRIRANTFAKLLMHLQTMVKHAHRAVLKDLSPGSRRVMDTTQAALMDIVVPAAAGSFRFVLVPTQAPDMFGHSELTRALERMDVLFENVANPQESLVMLQKHRGHLAGAYLKFLRFLREHQTGLRYSWATPTFSQSSNHAVSEAEAGLLVEILSSVKNLGCESVALVGQFQKFNRNTGTWGILTDGGVVSGQIKEKWAKSGRVGG